ncbi:LuxR C-terminal-related transcriptional regulator, partial [Klebsiella pneumoniae]
VFAGKKSAQIREILINESAWEEMTCLFALSLNLSPKTVNSYRYRMFSKLNIHGDVELTHLAIRHGLCNAESLASQ